MNDQSLLNLKAAVSLVDEVSHEIEPLKKAVQESSDVWGDSLWQGFQHSNAIFRQSAEIFRKLDDAIDLASKAAAADPKVSVLFEQRSGDKVDITPQGLIASAYINYGILHFVQKNLAAARQAFEKSLNSLPNADAELRLASVMAAQGEANVAEERLRRLTEVYPNSPQAVEAVKCLRELERMPVKKRLGAKSWGVTLVLSIFLGWAGVDRFYLGYTGLGLIKLFTCGGFYIWWLIDIVRIATNSLLDASGKKLAK